MDKEKFLVSALSVIAVIATVGWLAGEFAWATKIVAIIGIGCLVSVLVRAA